MTERLQKIIASRGIMSRRKAEEMIAAVRKAWDETHSWGDIMKKETLQAVKDVFAIESECIIEMEKYL